MKFLIRADASLQIGSGHIMRCLTLAKTLRENGHFVQFITREHVGHLADFVREQGFECVLLPKFSGSLQTENEPQFPHSAWLGTTQTQDIADCEPHIRALSPDWIIADHYALSAIWQTAAKNICGSKIMAIDDLHDRPHAADLLLDQNHAHTAQDYAHLLPETCRVLAGTRYALLRDEFATFCETSLARRKTVSGSLQTQNVLINLGGVDKDNYTLSILKSLKKQNSGSLSITIVMGKTAPHINSIRQFAETAPFECRVLVNANNMAELMAQADWAIGAAGSTSWERCCLGLPTLLLVIADNQRTIAEQLQQVGAAISLHAQEIDTPKFAECVAFFRQPENLAQMSEKAARLCDAFGAKRVAQHIEDLTKNADFANIRRATLDDCRQIFEWRNHADIRKFMFNTDELIWENHTAWFAKQLSNPDFIMLIYQVNDVAQGYVSFTHQSDNAWEWGFYLAPTCSRGQGSRMGRLALAWAFAELGTAKIIGQVLPHNIASLKLHEKLGFFRSLSTSEGTQPEKDNVAQFELSSDKFLGTVLDN
ncbi:UDP-2,4-diacetamido-2,4,6-trideoxy-beta-L-altropyranose hydrolase [Kingella kingae]|uniref:UDP-2,4-diacetamido-2,4, 6-trideoxy-beta-L-altropyranose hydrolase n=2 Tax=Kingella kingae TaxID=504 RepID=UPI00041CE10C|nr:UDP-2,4-diacetamido-2,4,6-trideoxy-beta-L-altropyranose hydrolase [Kingella kingae]